MRVILPGALIALALTAGATFALVLALGVRGEGPLSLLLGGSEGTARLQDREQLVPVGNPGGRAAAAPLLLPGGGVAVTAAQAAPGPRSASGLRGSARVRRGATRQTQTPARRTLPPAATPAAQPAPTTPTATRPTATSAPAPAVKVRGRGKAHDEPRTSVPKSRVSTGAPAPPTSTPAPSGDTGPRADAPVVEKRPVHPTPTPDTGVGQDDGVLHRVPAPPPAP
jgi:hypothetical protein